MFVTLKRLCIVTDGAPCSLLSAEDHVHGPLESIQHWEEVVEKNLSNEFHCGRKEGDPSIVTMASFVSFLEDTHGYSRSEAPFSQMLAMRLLLIVAHCCD